jgi:hypothetical protein
MSERLQRLTVVLQGIAKAPSRRESPMRKFFIVAAAVVAAALAQASAALAGESVRCTGPMTGTIDANLIVPRNAFCELTDAHVTGNVIVQRFARLDALNSRIEGNIICSGGPSDQDKWCDLLSGTVVEGNGIVGRGGELHLHGGHVLGNVRAGPGSVFLTSPELEGLPAATALVGGNVRCIRCIFVDLVASRIEGNVLITRESEGSFIVEGNEILGRLQILRSSAGEAAFVIAGNTIHRSVTFSRNRGPTQILENVIGGNLRVLRNRSRGEFCFDPEDPESCFEGLMIAGNEVEETLNCQKNRPAPVGGGNTAERKLGQCREL